MKTTNRPEITEERLEQIRKTILENPGMGRTKLSVVLCEIWGWRDTGGRVKDMSCRDLLSSLEKAGRIDLPPRIHLARKPGDAKGIKHLVHDETPIVRKLGELQPLDIEVVTSRESMAQFQSYIDQYHYLKFDRFIGERMAYLVSGRNGEPLACLLFGSAAWSCKERDSFIRWSKDERSHGLKMLTNNSRFLIFPWVNVPHLASHILSLVAKRIGSDWELKYGHGLCLLETFVECGRFKGTCYKAANWINVGRTTGRGRDGGHHNAILPQKDVYLYPLVTSFRQALSDTKGMVKLNGTR